MEVILPAIDVQNVYKAYNKKTPVLQGTDLLVKRGNIYGLLGPSGCGKTTLLKLIIGRLQPESGNVHVLGYRPGTAESQVPGSRVGYMPQELALYQEFTVSETLYFFGRIHRMTGQQIEERLEFLLKFLDIPSAKRKVSQLSGGQQRRVSLAVALLHSPEILILDEPTVGVDPLLRTRIWDHLVGISTTNNTTIIITTHYIEEARSANAVGLMRSGRILAEGPPSRLMERFKQTSLEDVFLHLCMRDDNFSGGSMKRGKPTEDEKCSLVNNEPSDLLDVQPVDLPNGISDEWDDDVRILDPDGNGTPSSSRTRTRSILSFDDGEKSCSHHFKNCCSSFPKPTNITALVIKNFNQIRRKIGFMLFQFLLPAIQVSLFAFCIGGTPKNLSVDLVDMDTGFQVPFLNKTISFSDAYVSQLDPDIFTLHNISSVEAAKQRVKDGTSWAVLMFPANFSKDSLERMRNSSNTKPDIINGSTMSVWMDETNQQIVMTLKANIILAYEGLPAALKKQVKDRLNISGFNISAPQIPIDYRPPIYGTDKETFLDFVAPGILCSIIYSLAIGLTTLSLVIERKEGLFERSLVSGVTVAEIMLGHIGTQFIVMAIQTAVLIIFAFLVFGVYNVGPIIIIIMFELLLGFTGMNLGFAISAAAQDEQSATQLSLATVFPFLLISGILWPIQAMPQWLQYISVCTPLTLAVDGLRCVIGRGWGFTHYEVWRGYCVAFGWGIGFLVLSLLISKVKKLN